MVYFEVENDFFEYKVIKLFLGVDQIEGETFAGGVRCQEHGSR